MIHVVVVLAIYEYLILLLCARYLVDRTMYWRDIYQVPGIKYRTMYSHDIQRQQIHSSTRFHIYGIPWYLVPGIR